MPAVPPLGVVAGINREAAQPVSVTTKLSSATTPSRRKRLGPKATSPKGSRPASQSIGLSPGHLGHSSAATLVATVTVIVELLPSAADDGFTTQVEFAGAPEHTRATAPGTPAADVSSSGYTA